MTPSERLVKLFDWGDKNNIVIIVRRFKQIQKDRKKFIRWFEVEFMQVHDSNACHRSSRGKGEDLGVALDNVWKNYKRKG